MSRIVIGDDVLEHYGMPRRSGRYPWGSGKDPYQSMRSFKGMVDELRSQGFSDQEIATSLGIGVTDKRPQGRVDLLKARLSMASAEIRAENRSRAMQLRDKGMSISAIGRQMGINESSVRSLLDDSIAARQNVLNNTVNILKDAADEHKYVDVGKGIENHVGVNRTRLLTAIALLEDEGYNRYWVNVGTGVGDNKTTTMVLAAPDVKFNEVKDNADKIHIPFHYSENGGKAFNRIQPPRSVDSNRIMVTYGEEGKAKDGLIEVRRGVPDLDMGTSSYAQVRILVDGTHYMKGVAVVRDDMPPGVDIIYNTPKESTGNKLDAMKPIGLEKNNPFGSYIRRQKTYVDENGNKQITALNIIQEEGDWHDWSKTLSSQMLGKQPDSLARQQLKMFRDTRRAQLEEIKTVTSDSVKIELLRQFADKADSDAVDLKAMGLPGTSQHVLIPIPQMRDTEVYAPQYKNGERVALIRHPHGGIFEIPDLVVNNNNRTARKIIGKNAPDAIGINAKVAEQLSGADFDGDTVLVIPNSRGLVKHSRPLKGLQDFDPHVQYAGFPGMKTMKKGAQTQTEMGRISNLITDMQLKGATEAEVVRAVKHSMVVIDAAKHGLNYKQSEIDNGIAQLRNLYQRDPKTGSTGASTLLSRAKSGQRMPELRPARVAEGGPINPKTGALNMVPSGKTRPVPIKDKDGNITGWDQTPVIREYPKMRLTEDARTLMSSKTGTPKEVIYAQHANELKALANEARRIMVNIPTPKKDANAARVYKAEVESLRNKLNEVHKNRPLERKAQALANVRLKSRIAENPDMTDDQVKKARRQELDDARAKVGLSTKAVEITPREWEAIQARALSHTPLMDILQAADDKQVKEYATPRESKALQGVYRSRAIAMLNKDYTQAEIAEALGVSVSLITDLLKNK